LKEEEYRMKCLKPATLWLLLILGGSFFLSPPDVNGAPPLPGAIFTTNADGTRVNQNIFPDKCSVYLDGGPGPNAPQGAAGLTAGDYFFQVTDPSGQTLLSTDPVVSRQFRVSGGIITGVSGLGNHLTGLDQDHGARTIQLCPYLDTPNPGGVYKVWVTPVDDFHGDPTKVDNACGHGCFHGFLPAASKTDNFKIRGAPLPCLIVAKVVDGVEVSGWPLTIIDPIGTEIQGVLFTGSRKECIAFNLVAGAYQVIEGATDGTGTFTVIANIVDGKTLPHPDLQVSVRIRNANVEVVFVNARIKK
jgi:hypothetical protein